MTAEPAIYLVTAPLLAAIGALIGGKRTGLALAIAASLFSIIVLLILGQSLIAGGPLRYEIGGFGSPLGINIKIDGLNILMLMTTAGVVFAASIYSGAYFTPQSVKEKQELSIWRERFFWPLWLMAFAGLNALFLSLDIFNIYVCLEVMTFAAIALVTVSGTVSAVAAALRYLLMSVIGSLSYLMGVAMLYSSYGVLDLNLLSGLIEPDWISGTAISFITLGLIIKSALFPFHFWLPPAHSNAPAPVSAMLSALVVMAAFYLLIEFWFELFAPILNPLLGQVIGTLALCSIFYGSLRALWEPRLKMLIAYSTISQVGYMFLIFPLAITETAGTQFAWNGAVYFALSHALAKASLFMCAGSLIHAFKHDRIEDLKGIAKELPIIVFTFALGGLSLIGLPPSGGFIGKWQLIKAAMFSGQWWYALLMIAASLITACYIFRVLEITLKNPGENDQMKPSRPVPLSMQYSAFILSLIAIFMGIFTSLPLDIMNINYKEF